MTDWIVVLAKDPRGGAAKTRLAQGLGMEWAARLAEAFVLDTLALAQAGSEEALVAFTPEGARGWFADRAPAAVLAAQPEGNLGARLVAAFAQAFERGAHRAIAIGTDTPHLAPERLREAFEALERADLCLGPAHDGGYYLFGLREPRPELFAGVSWSTGRVLAETLERAHAAGLDVELLSAEHDVDEASDLEPLLEALALRSELAPRTRAALVGLDPR